MDNSVYDELMNEFDVDDPVAQICQSNHMRHSAAAAVAAAAVSLSARPFTFCLYVCVCVCVCACV